ncbi:transcriptional repressor [Campylobacter sp. JMF_01 NE2]|uniref:Fur family transcriptional regulator n=1 Tax=unclassified Campylobacter TaxID=2593542 RepID=UPI001B4C1FCA|nr:MULTISPECIES: Fur family transcriptional regulator [unclassified Campylobacter]MBP3225256.1 transcriptional repressor [Campylobacter sp.]MDA3043719.1 transcriptional repressor [Campylobacter sp. JMF_09 ED2]MDA3045330.1 transcriptional repressor [Campylobacter sp. JMF_07 ED4]MDA3046999.1 transcriptional repressor [Campylobacter sp. VBCF_06 NA8]MDA3048102.1 transcriptional repressor [Campylobacter sp. JMF_08 NE1]
MTHVDLLKNCGLKATPQRLCILKVLDRHEHPNIDSLYDGIKEDYPSISLATVYKNLNRLLDEGVVVEVNTPNQKPRYDIYNTPHMHVVCEKCGNVSDMFMGDIFMDDMRTSVEKQLKNFVRKLNITATVEDCEFCR